MKDVTCWLVAIIMVAFAVWLFLYQLGNAAGEQCDWASDCGYNEKCKQVPYINRSNGDKTGICVPREW